MKEFPWFPCLNEISKKCSGPCLTYVYWQFALLLILKLFQKWCLYFLVYFIKIFLSVRTLRLLAAKIGIHYPPWFTVLKSLLPLLWFRKKKNVFEISLIHWPTSSLCYVNFCSRRENFYYRFFIFYFYSLGLHSAHFQSSLFFLIVWTLF